MNGDTQLELKLTQLQNAARSAQETIHSIMGKHPMLDRITYSLTSRVKSIRRMAEKYSTIHTCDTSFTPEHLPDICGFRIITYFQSGIMEGLELLLALAKHEPTLGPSPFQRDEIRAISLYTSRHENDPLSITRPVGEIVTAANLNPKFELSTRETLYSSVHVVLACQTTIETAHGSETCVIPVEFQIRSVFEEAWGQISHILSYGRIRGTGDLKTWRGHLNVLKALVDGCIQYAELIKEQSGYELANAEAEKETPKSTLSLSDAIAGLPDMPDDLRQRFVDAFKVQNIAISADITTSAVLFSEAANAFKSIEASALVRSDVSKPTKDKIIFWSKLSRAHCLLYSADEFAIDAAIDIYEEISRAYPTDSVSRFRYGQALRRKTDMAKAIALFMDAIQILEDGRDRSIGDDHWIRCAAFRELGYTYWLVSEELESLDEKLGTLRKAIESTRSAVERSERVTKASAFEEKVRSINNFLYYGWEERNLIPNETERAVSDQELRATLNVLLSLAEEWSVTDPRQPGLERYAIFDTICRALDYLQDHPRAAEIAGRVVQILLEKLRLRSGNSAATRPDLKLLQRHLTPEEVDSYLYAVALIGEASNSKRVDLN